MIEANKIKIAFVVPWFGMNISGGAETETRELALKLNEAGLCIEILTTCVESFSSDWNHDYYKPGIYTEGGLTIKRFKTNKRNVKAFDEVNYKLIQGQRVSSQEEEVFIREMVNSSDLYAYMEEKQEEYMAYIVVSYMFGTTYFGSKVNPKKVILIPCFHDESYFYMSIFKNLYSKVGALVYNAEPEKELVHAHYPLEDSVKEIVMGIGMDTDIEGDENRFREKYQINDPFILYAGRKDAGKNVDILLNYFNEYKKRNDSDLKLVLIGGGNIDIPQDVKDSVLDLGFVDIQDKYDAYAAAMCLCQPSTHESFSLVIMESWLCGKPVLVHGDCAVTRNFVHESNGGLYFQNYFEFEGSINYYFIHDEEADQMASNGKAYVLEKFAWNKIIENYISLFEQM